jgi:hypothetical protein
MGPPETGKGATSPGSAPQKIEQLGGQLDKTNTETLDQLQARSLRHRFAIGYYFATTVAPLIWGLPR